MVIFHLFITSTFPLAVPLEWNVLFAFAAVFLFWGHPAWHGFAVTDFSSPLVLAAIIVGLLFFPVLGNLRPDLVSFLPSLRQYAGNWASASWAFAPGAEAKLDNIVRGAGNTVDQLAANYPRPVAEILLNKTIAWRAMHSQGPALNSMLVKQLGADLDRYTVREAEFGCNTVIGFQLRRRPFPQRALDRRHPEALSLRADGVHRGLGRVPADPQGPPAVQDHRRRPRSRRARLLQGCRRRGPAAVAARRANPARRHLDRFTHRGGRDRRPHRSRGGVCRNRFRPAPVDWVRS